MTTTKGLINLTHDVLYSFKIYSLIDHVITSKIKYEITKDIETPNTP